MKRRVCIAIVVMGFSGLVAEILLLRELLIVFSGNELSVGVILANWLILEACGCFFLGRTVEKSKNKLVTFTLITILFSLSLFVAVFPIRFLKNILGVSIGERIGLLPIFYSSFLILLPVSILHGALFTFSCRIYSILSGRETSAAGTVYVYETVGTLLGGIASTFLFVRYFNTFQITSLVVVVNMVAGLVLLAPYWKTGLFQKGLLALLSVLVLFSGSLLIAGWADSLHRFTIRRQWKNLNVVHYENSQYGNICVVENEGQYIYFLDGIPGIITPVPDIPSVEEFVHIPLLAHPQPQRILMVSGGVGGTIHEALKHPSIESITYVELDPLLLSLLREFPTSLTGSELTDERVKIHHGDGRLLLKTTPNTYDVIFIGITEPSNLQANRFFTQEFFSLAEKRLNEGGILVLGAPGSLTLLNEELKDLNSTIFHTLNRVFSHIRVIPGDGRNVFLSSDSLQVTALDKQKIIERLNRRDITTETTVPRHIENKLHRGWQDWFNDFIEEGTRNINYDFKPLGVFYSISYWNALFAPSFGLVFKQFERINIWSVLVVILLFLIFYLLLHSRHKRAFPSGVPLSITTTGFAGMIFDLVVIFAFQSLYGYVFSWMGVLVASFMAGAACGAIVISKALERIRDSVKLFLRIEQAIVCFSLVLPFIFLAGKNIAAGPVALEYLKILFLVIPFVCGFETGSQFPLGNTLYLKHNPDVSSTAGLLYASDLIGGWTGGIIGGVILLPVLGLVGTCITVGVLKLASFIVLTMQSQSVSIGGTYNG